jgi:uncharacterized protein (DUF58 family)
VVAVSREWLTAGEIAGRRYAMTHPRRAAGRQNGFEAGRGLGSSAEFMDHREYVAGDDLRRVDWNASARSDRLIVRVHREEITPNLDLVLDGSRSMALDGTQKTAAAAGLVGLLAAAARGSGWRSRMWSTSEVCEPIAAEPTIAEVFPPEIFDSPANPIAAFRTGPPRFRPGSIRVLISDLLFPGDPHTILHRLTAGAAAAVVVQLLAQTDVEPPVTGNLQLVDIETASRLEVRMTDVLAGQYRRALEHHGAVWRRASQSLGVLLVSFIAEPLVATWDVSSLVEGGLLEAAP